MSTLTVDGVTWTQEQRLLPSAPRRLSSSASYDSPHRHIRFELRATYCERLTPTNSAGWSVTVSGGSGLSFQGHYPPGTDEGVVLQSAAAALAGFRQVLAAGEAPLAEAAALKQASREGRQADAEFRRIVHCYHAVPSLLEEISAGYWRVLDPWTGGEIGTVLDTGTRRATTRFKAITRNDEALAPEHAPGAYAMFRETAAALLAYRKVPGNG